MPASKKKKKTTGTVVPEVETEPPPPALLPEDARQMSQYGETSEYTLPSEDDPIMQMKGKGALQGATSGNAPLQEPPLNPMSPLLRSHTQMIEYCQLRPPTPGSSVLPDYGSTPRPGRAQLINLPLTLEGRLPKPGNHPRAPSVTSETTHQGRIEKAIQQMHIMLEDCRYTAH
jgi:hypothetical protein